jgi:hypothetical protein
MHPILEHHRNVTRRAFFGQSGVAVGTAALASLLARDLPAADFPSATTTGGLPGLPHWAPKAKRIIYLMQSGAPSQVDLFDHKPDLTKHRGTELPESVHMGQRLTTMTAGQAKKSVLPSIAPFQQRGQSGMWLSDLIPHTAEIADDICLVRSMHTDAINHAPAMTFWLTGGELPGRPTAGAWLSYGLGSENENLPAFVALTSIDKEKSCGQLFFEHYWGSGFLPSRYQGVKLRSSGDPVLYLSNPPGVSTDTRRDFLDSLSKLNQLKLQATGDPEISTRITQYEMAYRMQASVPDLADIRSEPAHILEMYGPDVTRPGSFAMNCLLARRLSERGVRFVQLMHAGWDQHQNLPTQLAIQCKDTDQPSAALVKDLKQRGLLDETLIVWGGEFGRTVFCQGDMNNPKVHGRDHHPRCYSIWMAGGGIKPGTVYGETDEFSYNITKNPVNLFDLNATVLSLLGIDHTRLTFKFQGRHFRLTDVHGEVVKEIVA